MHSKLTMKNRKRPIFMCESTDLINRKRTIYELSRLKTASLEMNHSEVDQGTETDVFKSLSGICTSDSIGKTVDNLGSGELQYDQLNIINCEGSEILDSNSINNEDVLIKKFGSTFVSNEDTKEVHVLPDVNISQTYPLAKSDRQVNPTVSPTTKEIKNSDHIYVSDPKCKSSSPTNSKIMSALKMSKENDSADNTMDRNFISINYCNSSAISNSNNINISNAVKSQSVMNAKTVMSEITQTTAKVSIGNTTISVPLLKPVCSSKIVQDSVDIYKNQIKIKPQVHPQQGQPIAHLNPKNPALVNLRRGQKLNPPTIVSLSQLQIKPSNNAKIVQATVVSNKLQLKNYTDVITQSTVNISSIRGKPNYTRKLCYPKQANMVNHIAVRNKQCVDDMKSPTKNLTSHSISKPLLEGSGDLEYQASISNDNLYNINRHVLPLVTKASVTNRSKYLDSTAEIQKKQYLDFDYSAIVIPPNKVFASETQPILSSVSKTEIKNIPLQKFKNTTREGISQHDTSSTSGATMSNITTVFATSTVPITQRNNSSSQAVSCSSNNLSYNTVSNVPQTISLVLSKTTANETSTTVLPVSSEVSIQNQANRNFTNQFTKENQFPKMITLKKTGNENSQHDITKSVPLTPVIASSAQFYINQNSGIIDIHCSQVKQETSLNKSKQIPNSPTELNIEREKPNQSTCTVMRKDVVDKTGVKFNCIKNKSEVNRYEKKKRSSTIITSVCDGLGDSTCLETIKQNNKKKFSKESPPRTEESQNILLKQLLKNTSLSAVQGISSIATSPSSMCNQALSNRKINVRAPSLGLVSSLEAQLARPVMPPVSATTGLVVDEPLNKETAESSTKLKQSMPLISKETSFVSNPRFCLNVNSNITSERISPHTQEVSISIPNNSSSTTDVCIPDLVSCSSPTDGISNLSESYINVSPNGELNKARGSTCFNLGNDFRCDKRMFPKSSYTVPENYIKRKGGHQSDTLNVKVTSSMEKDTYFSEMTNASVAEANNISLPVLTQVPVETVPYEKENKCVKGLTTSSETICKSHILDYFRTGSNSKNYSSPSKFTKNKDKVSNSLKYSNTPKKVQETNESIPEAKQRKKRKRDFHKQHTLSNNTETSNAVEFTNSKKRMRKPGRVEEDYDIFMDNLLNQMRKMASLDVLEPLLCNNKGICNMYGFSDLSKLFRNKEYENSIISKILNEQNQQWIKVRDFYEEQPFGCNKKPPEKKHLMQNNFYDQEFLADARENVEHKFYKVVNNTKFHNNMDSSEHVFAKNAPNYNALSHSLFPWDAFTQTTFPGLVVINDENLGRQSPVIPLVKPVPFKFGSILPPPSVCHPKRVLRKQLFISKFDEEENNLTVILTISSDEVLSVLKDLANILNISPISSYTIIEDVIKSNVPCSDIGNYKLRENRRSKYNDDIQDILNGVKQLCENCGFSACKLACMPFVSLKNSTKNLNGLETSAEHIYFCSKACCINFKYQLMSRSLMEVDMPQNFKKLINKSGFRKHKDLSITSNLSNLKKPRFKYFKMNAFQSRSRTKNITPKEITNILFDLDITMLAPYKSRSEDENKAKITDDIRRCILCNENGDGISNAASRLLNIDVNKWVHLNCALWSNGVYETISGGLMNVEAALQMGKTQICSSCHQLGATIKCFKIRCESVYHLLCAKKEGCIFYKNKSFHCPTHSKTLRDNELLTLEVQRRVFIEKDESHQIINIMRHQDRGILLRIGSIILLNVGKLMPHQMDTFHSTNCIYPIGYKTIRFYWSLKKPNTRCRYICTLSEISNRPEFTVRSMDSDLELRNSTANLVWLRILESIVALKKKQRQVQIFPKFISGDDLFGFTEPFIVRILESLPGVEILNDYRFKYGRSSLLELPLGIHSSGAARTEPQQRQVIGLKKPHTQRTATTANQRLSNSMVVGEVACPYSKQFVHSKSSQYKKMNQEWRNNVYLARSKIQGLGLYAARDLEKHTMVIEYIGEVIRTEVSEMRERQYGARNRGIYMFRLDEDRVVDATLSGGLARYINHSCNPNCVTEIVDVDREVRIIIFAKRRISRGEELSYDYKFDIEDDANKLPCMCGALNCRKWMN